MVRLPPPSLVPPPALGAARFGPSRRAPPGLPVTCAVDVELRVTVSPAEDGKFNVNVKGTTHIGACAAIRSVAPHPPRPPAARQRGAHLCAVHAGPWESEARAPRDLFVSGDAFIGRNVSDESFTLSVRGVAQVRPLTRACRGSCRA